MQLNAKLWNSKHFRFQLKTARMFQFRVKWSWSLGKLRRRSVGMGEAAMEAVAAVVMEVVVVGVMVMAEVVVAVDLDTMDKSEWSTSSYTCLSRFKRNSVKITTGSPLDPCDVQILFATCKWASWNFVLAIIWEPSSQWLHSCHHILAHSCKMREYERTI